jgi:hypothetical protein
MTYRQGVVGCGALGLVLFACGGTVDLRSDESSGGSSSSGAVGANPGGEKNGGSGGQVGEPLPGAAGEMNLAGAAPNPEPGPSCLGDLNCPWSLRKNMPLHTRGQAVVALDGQLYVMGGISSERDDAMDSPNVDTSAFHTVVYRYEAATDTWHEKAPLPQGLFVLSAHALGDEIYVFGGYGVDGFNEAVQIYDSAADQWREGPPAPSQRYNFSSQAVDGKVYVVGGQGPSSEEPDEWPYSTEVAIFDPANGWSQGSPLPKAIAGAASCALDGRIYLFGGETNNLTAIYDVAGDVWSSGSSSPIARNGHTCVQVAGDLIVLGGRNGSGTVGAAEKYDPASDTWESLDPMPIPSNWFGADALGTKVYVFGGEQVPGAGLLNRLQVFDFAKLP